MTQMKARPGDNVLTIKSVITGCVFVGGVVSYVHRAISTVHGSPVAGVCDIKGV